MKIEFGSDGFRGVIGSEFCIEAVERISLGVAHFLGSDANRSGLPIPIGYDCRFLSKEMALASRECLDRAGVPSVMMAEPCPSPYLAFATHESGAALGIQFTASHNPFQYNGIKLKGSYGGSLVTSAVAQIEAAANSAQVHKAHYKPAQEVSGGLNVFDAYSKRVSEAAGQLGRSKVPIIVDYMHGCTSGIYRRMLESKASVVQNLRSIPDPLFGGDKPEPVESNLQLLIQTVREAGGGTIGLAFDGDGDRLAVVDELGRCLQTHEIYCLLLEDIAKDAKPGEIVVTTVSFSGLVERVAQAHGLNVYEVPVGFRHVTQAMLDFEAIMGGEESGGAGFGDFLPERDALLMALRLLHFLERSGKTLNQAVKDLHDAHGSPLFLHRDYALAPGTKHDELRERVRTLSGMTFLAGDEVVGLNHRDGMKLKTQEGWVLVRPSGTEPLLRVYAEAGTMSKAEEYAQAALTYLKIAELR